jgi:Flp pilus assembly protein TadB
LHEAHEKNQTNREAKRNPFHLIFYIIKSNLFVVVVAVVVLAVVVLAVVVVSVPPHFEIP